MKRAFYIIAMTLLLAMLHAIANAQDTQELSAFPCYAKAEGCVQVEYDRFKDKTFVTMTPVQLTDYSSWMRLTVGAEFSSPGNAVKRPETVTFKFIASALSSNPFADEKGVYLLIDGKPYPLGDLSLEKESPRDYESRYSLQVPFEVIEKIASSKLTEIRISSGETILDEKVKGPFRRLVELAPKRESSAPAKDAPRPKPARTSRKRGRP